LAVLGRGNWKGKGGKEKGLGGMKRLKYILYIHEDRRHHNETQQTLKKKGRGIKGL
jgi:hypothetical protein